MLLFRPVGVKELELIAHSAWKAFPPRLPEQPIFYPVLNQAYAEQIARDWNTKDPASGYAGFVTCFELPDDYAAQFDRQVVGDQSHEELWVPAEDLEVLNSKIVGTRVCRRTVLRWRLQGGYRRHYPTPRWSSCNGSRLSMRFL
ncbi:MAG: ADP-ribosylation/crystallin J1 [Planctomycetota bacterium]